MGETVMSGDMLKTDITALFNTSCSRSSHKDKDENWNGQPDESFHSFARDFISGLSHFPDKLHQLCLTCPG
jgi:hypothetical protein